MPLPCNFTVRETKLLNRLRKEERLWLRARWLMLGVGVVSTLMTCFWGWVLYHSVHWDGLVPKAKRDPLDATEVFVLMVLWTKCCIWFVLAVWSFTSTWLKWNGDPKRTLLLRLLEALETLEKDRVQDA
jgi:hypothetical protein